MLGKIVGGGMPVGAYGGRRELMDLVAPTGPVYQAGTLSGHPLTMAAGRRDARRAAAASATTSSRRRAPRSRRACATPRPRPAADRRSAGSARC